MNDIVPTSSTIIRTFDDAERAARAMAASGFFADSRQAAQAVVKIMAGLELGFGPFASMTGVHIIQNKPVLAANLMAAAVKRTGKYNYRVIRLDDTGCELEFYEGAEKVGRSAFTSDDAKKAGLLGKDNWNKFPRNMYFARALSNGQKWYAPDVFNGATVYTPDELGAQVDEEGNAVIQPDEIAEPELAHVEDIAPDAMSAEATVKAATKKPAMPETLPQRIVREGITDNVPHASQLLNVIGKHFKGLNVDETVHTAALYEAWRKSGKEQAEAIVMAQSGRFPEDPAAIPA